MNNYSSETQRILKNYILNERKLNPTKIKKLIKQNSFIKRDNTCFRCGSEKKIKYNSEFFPFNMKQLKLYTLEEWEIENSQNYYKKEMVECLVCGYEYPSGIKKWYIKIQLSFIQFIKSIK